MKSRRQSFAKKRGNLAEQQVQRLMHYNGYSHIEKVHDAWRPIQPLTDAKGNRQGGKWICVMTTGTLSGDLRAVAPGGRSVLVEVKARDGNLIYSTLQEHQRKSLDAHARAGGLSLVAWVADHGTYFIEWPIEGFIPRSSIDATWAARIAKHAVIAACHPDNARQHQPGGEKKAPPF